MSPEEAWLMVDVMKNVIQRGTAAGSVGSVFHLPAGGKTGTTNDGTDVWFIGYTADLVAGVWMGFDRPQKIKNNAHGGVLAAPAWTAFMTEAYRRKPSPPDWPMPPNIVVRQVDFSTNLLATPYCPRDLVGAEFYIPGTDPIRQCYVHTGYVYPDTSAVNPNVYPPGAPPSQPGVPYPPGSPPPVRTETLPVTGVVIPRGAPPPRVVRPPRDTTRRRDTMLVKPPDSTRRRPDTTRIFPIRPPDSDRDWPAIARMRP